MEENQTSEIDWSSLNLNITKYINNYDLKEQLQLFDYLSSLTKIQRQSYNIAYEHLGSSFNIFKSNGYIEWKSKK